MKTEEIIAEKIIKLPTYLHLELIDFIDFLLVKYSKQNDDNNISEEHKQILLERLEKYKNNPEVGNSWEDVKARLMKKYVV